MNEKDPDPTTFEGSVAISKAEFQKRFDDPAYTDTYLKALAHLITLTNNPDESRSILYNFGKTIAECESLAKIDKKEANEYIECLHW